MKAEDLVRMANQIGDYYAAYPEDEAVAGVAKHIQDFWDPRMRAALAEIVARDAGLSPITLKAARLVTARPH